jgi:hypothetical protein
MVSKNAWFSIKDDINLYQRTALQSKPKQVIKVAQVALEVNDLHLQIMTKW